MVPKTDDGRVLFAVPWQDRVVIGTTDTAVDSRSLEPRALEEEIEFLLVHAARYLTEDPGPGDVLSVFAGLRPLIRNENTDVTSALSRDHSVLISRSGLVTLTGGKWTTYRKMGQDVIDRAATVAGLDERASITEDLKLHGWAAPSGSAGTFGRYGSDAPAVEALVSGDAGLGDVLHRDLPYIEAEVVWAVRHEMARTVEDVLARRTRSLLLGARISTGMAPRVASIMARELGRDTRWETDQVDRYKELAAGYVL
jgi:glycerol-3-phosphate dehydrogenase